MPPVAHSPFPWVFHRRADSIVVTTLDGSRIAEIYGRTWLGWRYVGDRQVADAQFLDRLIHDWSIERDVVLNLSTELGNEFQRLEMKRLRQLQRLLLAVGLPELPRGASIDDHFDLALGAIARIDRERRSAEVAAGMF